MNKQRPTDRLAVIVGAVLLLWMYIVYSGTRLPYLYTEFSVGFRWLVVFPILFLPTIYFAFFHRKAGKTGLDTAVSAYNGSKSKNKVFLTVLGGAIFIPTGIAWTSIAYPAWTTYLFAENRYSHTFKIETIVMRSGPKWSSLFDLGMVDDEKHEVNLQLDRTAYMKNPWKIGDRICVTGRTWFFGTIIDETSRCQSGALSDQ